MAKTPRVTVTERNLQTDLDILADPRYQKAIGNPMGRSSAEVALKDPAWVARWFNEDTSPDHIWSAKNDKAWDDVRPEDVLDLEQIGGYTISAAGNVVRGERGKDRLMKTPRVVRAARMRAKTEWNNRHMGNPNAMKNEVVEAAGRSLGSEAADYLNTHTGPVGGVVDKIERVERVESE